MKTYLEAEIPKDLCENLFLSFMKRPAAAAEAPQPSSGKDGRLKEVAAMASQMACAAVVHQDPTPLEAKSRHSHLHSSTGGLAEKLHGLSEKLHSLGHGGQGQSQGDGKRSRAGRHDDVGFACSGMF